MITIEFPQKAGCRVRHIWLAPKPLLSSAAGFCVYYNCASTRSWPGFVRERKRKMAVDISAGGEAVVAAMGQDARYKLRRAQREGGKAVKDTDMAGFLGFYNDFAAAKKLPLMDGRHLEVYWPHMVVTTMWIDNERASSHAWVISSEEKKASLMWAPSCFRQISGSQERNRLSRAHLLHYLDDMMIAAEAGCTTYDFGYFGQLSEEMEAVNRFKSQFPCTHVDVSTYTSLPLHVWKLLRRNTVRS
jgi:hypothetical protein